MRDHQGDMDPENQAVNPLVIITPSDNIGNTVSTSNLSVEVTLAQFVRPSNSYCLS